MEEVLASCLKLDILSLMIFSSNNKLLYYSLVYPLLSSGLIFYNSKPCCSFTEKGSVNNCIIIVILILDNFFSLISSKHGYSTRLASKSAYYIHQVRTNYAKFNIHFSGPSVWNNLVENLKNSSLKLFKQTMKADILSTYC